MERVIQFAYQKPLDLAGLLLLIGIATLAPLPMKKRYEWDNVRKDLTVAQRLQYGLAGQILPILLAAFLSLDLFNGLAATMAILQMGFGLYIILGLLSVGIYLGRVISARILNGLCDAAYAGT